MAGKSGGNGKLDKLDEAMAVLVHAQAQMVQNQTAFQQALLQSQARSDKLHQELNDRMERKFAEIDRRLDNIEAFLMKMSAEMPERVFGFAQAHQKPN